MEQEIRSAALYCYSKEDFVRVIEQMGWSKELPLTVAVISIGCQNEDDNPHPYSDGTSRVINLDFDDVSPEVWWNEQKDVDFYDVAMSEYIEERQRNLPHDMSSKSFYKTFNQSLDEHVEDYDECVVHAMDYEQADKLERFIADCVKDNLHIYVHCSAGISRSQGVVRFILDTYPEINWKTRESNPCRTPNIHVVRMLKRAYIFNSNDSNQEFSDVKREDVWEPMTQIIPELRTDENTKEEYIVYRLLVRGQEFELRAADVIGISMDANHALTMSKEDIRNYHQKK